MTHSKYRLALRILHPTLDLSNIFSILSELEGFQSGDLWIAGRHHVNSEGRKTESVSKFSRCIFLFPEENVQEVENTNVAIQIEKIIEKLESQKDAIKQVINLGAKLDVWITWRIYSNSADTFDSNLIKRLSNLDASISLDLYAFAQSQGNGRQGT